MLSVFQHISDTQSMPLLHTHTHTQVWTVDEGALLDPTEDEGERSRLIADGDDDT